MKSDFSKHFAHFIADYPLERTAFWQLCEYALQEEFLAAQQPFFHAVQAFPQMLAMLASKIKTSENRLLVMQNLWEEHGQGEPSKFHTATYKQYLRALGWDGSEIKEHPAVQYWIENLVQDNSSSSIKAAQLCGIEYIYTRISEKIVNTLGRFDLHCEQSHYAVHASLDVEHAQEMMQVMMAQFKEESEYVYSQDIVAAFEEAVDNFILMLNQLSLVTQRQLQEIARDKVAFYYSRETSEPELECLEKMRAAEPEILIVCSGGEHLFNIARQFPQAKITALDINPCQLELAQEKLSQAKQHRYPQELEEGKFEKVFSLLRSRLFNPRFEVDDRQKISQTRFFRDILDYDAMAHEVFKSLCEDIFSNKNLQAVFTEEATKYSSDSFARHFAQLLLYQIADHSQEQLNPNLSNILGLGVQNDYGLSHEPQVQFFCGSFEEYFATHPQKEFDLISVSNIGDWMVQQRYKDIIRSAQEHLTSCGSIVARKLLGDYSLEHTLKEFGSIHKLKDGTGFYTEVFSVGKC